MGTSETIKKRYSCRNYKNDQVPEEILNKILEAIRLAPSACNIQPYRFIIVRDKESRKKLSTSYYQSFINEAPILIVGCALEKFAYRRMGGYGNSGQIDLAIAMDHLTLVAADERLGTCWIGSFKENLVKEILNIPEDVRVISLMTLGFPLDKKENNCRLPLTELIFYDSYGGGKHETNVGTI